MAAGTDAAAAIAASTLNLSIRSPKRQEPAVDICM
jgi:hypothetical protein